MTERPDHDTAERAFRELLRRNGLPDPDEVARWRDALVFGWRETKAIVVVDLDEFDPDDVGGPLVGPLDVFARAG
jgi:hypothetical protein